MCHEGGSSFLSSFNIISIFKCYYIYCRELRGKHSATQANSHAYGHLGVLEAEFLELGGVPGGALTSQVLPGAPGA